MKKQIRSTDISFTNLVYTVNIPKQNEKKNVLKGVSGVFKSGEITAIMGPSGAGKSSLLNILTGFTKEGVKGSIQIGDERSHKKSRKLCSYILQDDHLFPWFTVQETMVMAAKLKLPKKTLKFNMQDIIDSVLDSFNLKHIKNTKCGHLSGGQKKRLSVALEMLDNPQILFLDEPTTGLDSSASAYCIKLLADLAKEGRTIVCTIHQPTASVYEQFDHIYVLADGKSIYKGTAENTVPFLSSMGLQCPLYHNSADYLLEVANGEYGNFTDSLSNAADCDSWRAATQRLDSSISNNNSLSDFEMNDDENMNSVEVKKTKKKTTTNINNNNVMIGKETDKPTLSEISQLLVLIRRGNVQYFRDWTITHLKLLLHIICAIVIGLLFNDCGENGSKAISNIALIMISILYLWYTSIMPAVLRFPSEISVLRKEIFNNWYKLRTYYISTMITSAPIQMLFAFTFSSILYFMTYQPHELDRYLKFITTNILLTMTADGYGVFFGTIFNPINGTFFGAILSCYMLSFSGFIAFFPHMPRFMYYMSYTSVMRYGLEANVLSVLDNGRKNLICPDTEMYCHYKSGSSIIKELGLSPNNWHIDIINLLAQLVFIKTVAYFSLKRRLKY